MVEQFPLCNCRWWLFLFVCVCELRTYREKRKERKRSLATGGLGQFIQPKWKERKRKKINGLSPFSRSGKEKER